jgi:hypothetical protein
VLDPGTEELSGIPGTMNIKIDENGKPLIRIRVFARSIKCSIKKEEMRASQSHSEKRKS